MRFCSRLLASGIAFVIVLLIAQATFAQQPGSLDFSFDPGTGANSHVFTSFIQPDGKILIGGNFTSFNGTPRIRVARLHPDGSVDTSFDPGLGANDFVLRIVAQPDGKILIGGDFTSYDGQARNRVARLNADGSLDASFNPGTGANNEVYTLALQPDGKVIIAGVFLSFNGVSRSRIARLNADGSLDTSFNPGTGMNGGVWTLAVQPDGKIIAAGNYTTYNGTNRNRIARLHPNGTLDTSFYPGGGPNLTVWGITLMPDGRVLVGGEFTQYDGTPRNRLARLQTNGALDPTFDTGTGLNDWAETMLVLPSAKILIVGAFTSVNGTNRRRVARLNNDGSLDPAFDPGSGANDNIWVAALQADGKVIINGVFTSYDGISRNRIARIHGEEIFLVNTGNVGTTAYCPGSGLFVYFYVQGTYGAGNVFTAQLSDASGSFANPTPIGSVAGTTAGSIWATIPAGTPLGNGYRIRVVPSAPNATVTDNGSDLAIVPLPTVTATANQPICYGATATLTATGATSYSWSTGQTGSTISVAPSANTTYTVTGIQNGCQATDTVEVILKPQPEVNAGAPVTLCGGTPGQLQPLNQQPGYTYSWSPAAGLSSATDFSPTITLPNNTTNTPINHTYILTASFNGCSNSSSVQVTVNPRPTGTISGSVSVCPNVQGIGYSFSSSHPGTWAGIWGVSGGTISDPFATYTNIVNWGPTNSQAQVWIVPRNNYGCFGDTVKLPVTINVELITPTPAGPVSLCTDTGTTHTYSTFHTNGSTYQWGIAGGQLMSGQTTSQVQVQWQQPGLGKLWVLQQSITITDTCIGPSDTLFVQLLPLPDSTLPVQGDSSLCAGSTATYSLAGGAGSAYQWLVPGGQITSGQGTASIEVLWSTAGSHSVSVTETGSNGCVGRSISLQVQVHPVPGTTIGTAPAGFCTGNLGGHVYAVQGLAGSTYQWQIQGGQIGSGQGTEQVSISWDSTATVHSLSVTELSNFGCQGAPVTIPVIFDATRLQLLWVSVDTLNESQVLVHYLAADSANFPHPVIQVEREQGNGQFLQAGTAATSSAMFTDSNLQTHEQSYRYRLQGQNFCQQNLLSSGHATIWLQGQAHEQSGMVSLQWSAYEGWGNQQVEYQVWRKLDNEQHYQLLPSLTTTGTSLEAQLGRHGFRHCYRIKAIAADARQSWSNSVCLEFGNPVQAPNIITPNGDGKNDVLVLPNLNLYPNSELLVFSRWGREVYRTRDYRNNWGGDNLPSGLYFYQLSSPGKPVVKGWIEIVR